MSESKYGKKWTEDETIFAYYWYCQIPFGKIHKGNPDIIKIASFLGRTPSSVVLKMGNLGHFDPELKKRNVSGLENASKTDEAVVAQFRENWEALVNRAKEIEAKGRFESQPRTEVALKDMDYLSREGKERPQITSARVNQQFFRDAVLASYHGKCCITGIAVPKLLIASHIKPWSVSDPKTERTNPMNGLCLNALHDKAFDQGLITVMPNYVVKVSSKLLDNIETNGAAWLAKCDGQKILLPEKFAPNKEFLQYHNDTIFIP